MIGACNQNAVNKVELFSSERSGGKRRGTWRILSREMVEVDKTLNELICLAQVDLNGGIVSVSIRRNEL